MICTRSITAEDKTPFLATCESHNGHFLVLLVEKLDFDAKKLTGTIIQGFDSPHHCPGTKRCFFPYGDWRRLVSSKCRDGKSHAF